MAIPEDLLRGVRAKLAESSGPAPTPRVIPRTPRDPPPERNFDRDLENLATRASLQCSRNQVEGLADDRPAPLLPFGAPCWVLPYGAWCPSCEEKLVRRQDIIRARIRHHERPLDE